MDVDNIGRRHDMGFGSGEVGTFGLSGTLNCHIVHMIIAAGLSRNTACKKSDCE